MAYLPYLFNQCFPPVFNRGLVAALLLRLGASRVRMRLKRRTPFTRLLHVDGAHVVVAAAGGEAFGRDFFDAGEIAFR